MEEQEELAFRIRGIARGRRESSGAGVERVMMELCSDRDAAAAVNAR